MSHCSQCSRGLPINRVFEDVLCSQCVMQNQRLTRIITDSSELTETYIVGLPMDLRHTVKGYVEHS